MNAHDGHYDSRPGGGLGRPGTFTGTVLIACLAVFGLQLVAELFFHGWDRVLTVTFGSSLRFFKGFFWQPFTYMFLHGGIFHVVINMFILAQFGTALESHWGSRRFSVYYLVCGLTAGFSTIFSPYPTVGASGAVFGLLVAYGMTWPRQQLLMFFVIPMEARYACAVFFGLEVLFLLSGSESNVSHLAHVTGGVAGWLMLRYDRNIARAVDKIQERREELDREQMQRDSDRVDDLLDKINARGLHSLTESEKRFLKNVRAKRTRRGGR